MPLFKINVIGPSESGKTAYLTRILTGDWKKVPSEKSSTYSLTFTTNYGLVTFEATEGPVTKDTQGVIVIFSVTETESFSQAQEMVKHIPENIPIVLCGNKVDVPKDRKVKSEDIIRFRQTCPQMEAYLISAKSCYNFEKPFLSLARKLTGHSQLMFI